MKKLIYFLIFLLSMSLVLAVSVTTDKNDYSEGETVKIILGTCAETSIVKIIDPSGNLVDIKSNEVEMTYNTLSSSASGKYTVFVTCSDGATKDFFCVDSPSCFNPVDAACISDNQCSGWSFCTTSTVKQNRTCTDKNNCKPDVVETRECGSCAESWVCSEWGECSQGVNFRICQDENLCSSEFSKPTLQKSCTEADSSGMPPTYISTTFNPPANDDIFVEPEESFWGKYKLFILIPLILILIAVIILISLHFLKPKDSVSDFNQNEEQTE